MNDSNQPVEKAKALRHHLSEQFQKVQAKEPAPEELKKSVFDTLDSLQLIADVADLFTVKFAKSESSMVGLMSKPNENNSTNNPGLESAPPIED